MAPDVLAKTEAPSIPTPIGAAHTRGFSVLLVLSGFCGISYEVLYGRILGNFIGDQFAISSSILLTFMMGIGFGALYAHRLWSWLWLIEGAIGLYAGAMALGSSRVADIFYASSLLSHGIAGPMLACFLLLAVPSFLIGCSLPLFAGYLARLAPSGVFAKAYMLYNLGAAGTVLVVEFVLLRELGIQRTVLIMAGLNLFVSAMLWWRFPAIASLEEMSTISTKLGNSNKRHLTALVFASVASAVFQLLFVKVSECFLGPFRQTFALVLTVIFLGLAAGSAISRRWKPNFGWLLVCALVGLAWIAVGFEWIMRAYAWAHPLTAEYAVAGLANKLGALVLLMGVPAAAFGALIPALLTELGNVARQSGKLLFVSSLANAAGFLLMAFVLHRYVDYGLILLAIAGLLLIAIVIHGGFRSAAFQAGCVSLLLLGGAHHVRWDENLLYTGYDAFRDPDELAAARRRLKFPERFKGFQDIFSLNQVGNDVHFFINGYISIALNSPAEKIVGAFPSLFAPRTDHALVLGVGSGATSGTVATLFDHVDAVEINPVILPNLHRMAEHNFGIATRTNVTFVLDDAVHFTKICQKQYPLIINTVTAPIYFSSSKLYTVDFLLAVRRILEADGIYVTWVDGRIGDTGLDMIFKTVATAGFKHCALGGIKSGYFLL
ncbi:MAG TPA: hypothetical protein VMZ27_15035, partial [Candidatus Saccharimonadales bacterium]|nr:hypothetical protein [Candidatus Saccharimonadales bacterium]